MTTQNVTNQQAQKQAVERVLMHQAAHAIPSNSDLWPTVQRRLSEGTRAGAMMGDDKVRRAGRLRRVVVMSALVCTVVTASGTTAAVASPQVRTVMRQTLVAAAGTIGISVSLNSDFQSTGSFTMTPAPSFHYATPSTIPAALPLHAFGYVPASQPGSKPMKGVVALNRDTLTQLTQAQIAQDMPAQGPAIWLHFTSRDPATSYLDVVEQPAAPGSSAPAGETLSIGDAPATIQQQGDLTMITLVRFGTTVTIRTNMGRDTAVNGAMALTWQ